jgi:hypothetical protein
MQSPCCDRHDDNEYTYVGSGTNSTYAHSTYTSVPHVGSGTTPTVVLNLHTRGGSHSMTDNFIRSDNYKMTTLSSVDCTPREATILAVLE